MVVLRRGLERAEDADGVATPVVVVHVCRFVVAHLERHDDVQGALQLEVHVRRDHTGLVQLQRTSGRDVNRAVHDRRVEEVEVDAADRHGQLVATKVERGRRKVGTNQSISPLEVERRVLRKANGRELRNVVGPL